MNSKRPLLAARLAAISFWLLATAAQAATPEEIRLWLSAHNELRALHGAPPLEWSATLAASAQAYADSCPSGHSSTEYGENLAWITSVKPVDRVVRFWYDEEPRYDYHKASYSFDTGHFTQLVWRQTRRLGCGHATGCKTRLPNVWVCHYDPPGNYSGQFADNVLPGSGARPVGAPARGAGVGKGGQGSGWAPPEFH
jgi:hypothetical protein